MTRLPRRGLIAALLACGLFAPTSSDALVKDEKSPLAEKVVRSPNLHIPTDLQPTSQLRDALGARVERELAALGLNGGAAFYDARAGRVTSFILSEPLVPGDGVGNAVVGARPTPDEAGREAAWSAVRAYLTDHQSLLHIDVSELGAPSIGIVEDGDLIQVHVPRVLNGIAVRNSSLTLIVNHGNLILLGLENWADGPAAAQPGFGEAQARLRVVDHVKPFEVELIEGSQLQYIPMVKGEGYEYRLAWAVRASVVGDHGSWEGLVDANSGELLAFEDRNQYASRRMTGGVYPVSNDQRPPDGLEQTDWPMPFANVTIGAVTSFTNSGGSLGCSTGTGNTTLAGQFVRINDSCGGINESAFLNFDLGFGPTPSATDCTVPAGHSAGDTKSARSGYYELNRLIEQAKGYLPANTWLNNQLTSNMNLSQTCNAFWNGSTVNFYRDSGSACRNTGEIAAIFDHEWGHGLDANGANPSISSPGESIADIHATMRLNNSCVGRGFFKNQTCGGYGDPCIGTPTTGCTGVRDADFANHVSGAPHGITWIRAACGGGSAPCGRETHCEGQTVSEVAWDLQLRDMRAAPFNFDTNTALELTTRLFYLGAETVTSWYTCAAGCETAGTCGCGATGGYLLVLGADDDDGNLNNGTPHMTAIQAAFNRHQQACNAPAVVNSGCAGGPTTATTVTATPNVAGDGVDLTWTTVPGAARYFVYRTEGVAACDFGKVKVGNTTGLSFNDTGLLSGRPYSYTVLPVGTNTACFGRASACVSATPTAATCPAVADYSLSCSPNSHTILQGQNGTSACTVQSTNAFSAAVTLGCAGLPAGITCGYAPPTVTPPANGTAPSTLTVSVAAGTPVGTYNYQATGTSAGPNNHTFNMTVNVIAQADYTITCSPSSLTIPTGSSRTSTCTVQSLNAFASPVTLSCVGLPAGVTCGYVPPAVTPAPNGAITSTMTVNVPAGTTTGTFNFTAQGVGGGFTRTFPMQLVIVQSDFSLACSPNSVPVIQGQTGTSSCTVQSLNFFNSAVTLSCNGLPAGVTCGYAPPTVTPPSNGAIGSTMTVNVPAATPAGTYNFTAQGVGSGLTRTFNMELVVQSQSVAPFALSMDAAGNGVFQPNETATMAPTWRNTGTTLISLTGATTGFTGPAGPVYTNPDAAANYGTIGVSANGTCTTNGNCYSVRATAGTRPQVHWDTTILETVTPTGTTKTWTLHVGDSFTDMPASNGFYRFVETLLHKGVTGGCGPTTYCNTASTTRVQLAVFVLVAREGTGFNPPACGPTPMFPDVPSSSPFCRWVEELARRGVVGGCGGGNYCANDPANREQMAVFVLRTLDPTINPPACPTPSVFPDVPTTDPFCRWVEELVRRGVVSGCGGGNYCPLDPVTREQMGVFISVTFGLTLYGL